MGRKVNIEKQFEYPKQVQWKEEEICAGIGYKDTIICACCGGTTPKDEWQDLIDLLVFEDWVDFCPYIMGESHDELVKEADEEEL